jgi:hypothetical protein
MPCHVSPNHWCWKSHRAVKGGFRPVTSLKYSGQVDGKPSHHVWPRGMEVAVLQRVEGPRGREREICRGGWTRDISWWSSTRHVLVVSNLEILSHFKIFLSASSWTLSARVQDWVSWNIREMVSATPFFWSARSSDVARRDFSVRDVKRCQGRRALILCWPRDDEQIEFLVLKPVEETLLELLGFASRDGPWAYSWWWRWSRGHSRWSSIKTYLTLMNNNGKFTK